MKTKNPPPKIWRRVAVALRGGLLLLETGSDTTSRAAGSPFVPVGCRRELGHIEIIDLLSHFYFVSPTAMHRHLKVDDGAVHEDKDDQR